MSKLTLTENEAQEIADLIEGEARNDYSGRAMYGRRCFGIVTDSPGNLLKLGVELAEYFHPWDDDDHEEVLEAQRKVRAFYQAGTDNMGLSYIVYFPDVEVDYVETEEDDDE